MSLRADYSDGGATPKPGNLTAADLVAISNELNSLAKLVTIGDLGYDAAPQGNVASTAGTGEMFFNVGLATTDVTVLYNHWYTSTAFTGVDTDPSGSITFSASLRIVSSSNPNTTLNKLYRLTFGGRTTVTLDPGGRIIADLLGIPLSPGDVVAVRTFLSSGTAYAPRLTYGNVSGAHGGFTATSDLTPTGSAAITGSANAAYYGPSALLGHAEGAGTSKSVVVLGDSIGAGGIDSSIYTVPDVNGGGYIVRALSGKAGLINLSVSGDRATNFITSDGSFRRFRNALLADTAIIEYGTNDVNSGTSAANIEAYHLAFATNLRRSGITKVFVTTTVPRTTSTDGWATTTNQTPMSGEAQRLLLNAWVRANCPIDPTTKAAVAPGTSGALIAGQSGHPITGFFDVASAVESAPNSGKWKGAKRVATGSMTSGSNILTSSDANFQTANQEAGGDKGSVVILRGAGVSGADLQSVAAIISSTTSIALAGAVAGATVTGAQLNIGMSTVDGVHPSGDGHYLMQSTIDLSKL